VKLAQPTGTPRRAPDPDALVPIDALLPRVDAEALRDAGGWERGADPAGTLGRGISALLDAYGDELRVGLDPARDRDLDLSTYTSTVRRRDRDALEALAARFGCSVTIVVRSLLFQASRSDDPAILPLAS
jgi:hypothetical protein